MKKAKQPRHMLDVASDIYSLEDVQRDVRPLVTVLVDQTVRLTERSTYERVMRVVEDYRDTATTKLGRRELDQLLTHLRKQKP